MSRHPSRERHTVLDMDPVRNPYAPGTGLRGVGKTVLLNQLRSAAINRGWGSGKIEARPDQSLRRPVSSALHMALRELGPRHKDQQSIEEVLGVLKAFAQRQVETPSGA